jgi:hypothetical protein
MGDTRATAVLHGGQQLQDDTTETSTPHVTELPSLNPGFMPEVQRRKTKIMQVSWWTPKPHSIYWTLMWHFNSFPWKILGTSQTTRMFLSNISSSFDYTVSFYRSSWIFNFIKRNSKFITANCVHREPESAKRLHLLSRFAETQIHNTQSPVLLLYVSR